MSEEAGMKLSSLQRVVEEKLGVKKEKFDKVVVEKRAEVITKNPGATPDQIEKKTFVAVKAKFKKDLISPAKFFTGVFIYNGNAFDQVAELRAEALKKAKEDKELAIAEGYVNEEGFPLDRRETFKSGSPNRRFGKPLPLKSLLKGALGFTVVENNLRLFRLIVSDVIMTAGERKLKTDAVIPLFTPVAFRANVAKTQADPNVLMMNAPKNIEFVPDNTQKIDVMKMLSSDYLASRRIDVNNVPAWHDAHDKQADRVILVKGMVFDKDTDRNEQTGNLAFTIFGEEEEFESRGLRCWLPEYLEPNFEEGDEVIVIGQTTKGTFNDEPSYMLNVGGVYKSA